MHGIEDAGGRGDGLPVANRHRMITWATQHHVGVCGFMGLAHHSARHVREDGHLRVRISEMARRNLFTAANSS